MTFPSWQPLQPIWGAIFPEIKVFMKIFCLHISLRSIATIDEFKSHFRMTRGTFEALCREVQATGRVSKFLSILSYWLSREKVWNISGIYIVQSIVPPADWFSPTVKHSSFLIARGIQSMEIDDRKTNWSIDIVKLVIWHRLVSVNRWSIDNHTKIIHRLVSIGRGPRKRRHAHYLSDHAPFLGSPGDKTGKTILISCFWAQRIYSVARVLEESG